jgi:hypothetical protein
MLQSTVNENILDLIFHVQVHMRSIDICTEISLILIF